MQRLQRMDSEFGFALHSLMQSISSSSDSSCSAVLLLLPFFFLVLGFGVYYLCFDLDVDCAFVWTVSFTNVILSSCIVS